jgi:hypothetical protein
VFINPDSKFKSFTRYKITKILLDLTPKNGHKLIDMSSKIDRLNLNENERTATL